MQWEFLNVMSTGATAERTCCDRSSASTPKSSGPEIDVSHQGIDDRMNPASATLPPGQIRLEIA